MREALATVAASASFAVWRESQTILSLRGAPDNAAFCRAVATTVGLTLPALPCTSAAEGDLRLVWVGPDDWFLLAPPGAAVALEGSLRHALQGLHHSVADVSSGYAVARMSGRRGRAALEQGCPLDLHPRTFNKGMSAGSHFFKASVWLWVVDEGPTIDVMVRSSFRGYVDELLSRMTG